jgi:hypothetical protein
MPEIKRKRFRFSLGWLLAVVTAVCAYGGGWYQGLRQGLDEGFDERVQLHKEVAAAQSKAALRDKEFEIVVLQTQQDVAINKEVALRISKREHEAFERRFNAERRALGLPEEKFGP